MDQGWQPSPLRQFVLKVHQRCNLSCDYCYVYHLADQSWRKRPAVMPEAVWVATAQRIAQHVEKHRLTEIAVVLHGGEPLLAGSARLTGIAQAVRSHVPSGVAVKVGLQTNGTLLTEPMLDSLLERDIRVGVSLDGTPESNDLHRRSASGKGSYARVERGLRLLTSEPYRAIYSGLLCTIDPSNDPEATYHALLRFSPPAIDLLIPHTNWATPGMPTGTPIADWLIPIFDLWAADRIPATRVRLFDSIIRLLLGRTSGSDFVGTAPSVVAVVESDGAMEQTDALKSAYPGAADTGLSVLTDDFDSLLMHPGMVTRQMGIAGLSAQCQVCDLLRVCGGGHYAHRFHPESGFGNPSVYCADLKKLIHHIHRRVSASVDHLSKTETFA